jgi:hypothetical protein
MKHQYRNQRQRSIMARAQGESMTTETLEINANCQLEVWRLDGCETRVSLECSTYPACHAQSDTTISVDISEEQARQLVAALTSAFPQRGPSAPTTSQCGETCERAKLCATCAGEIALAGRC